MNNSNLKRLLSLFLALAMVFTLVPTPAHAEEAADPTQETVTQESSEATEESSEPTEESSEATDPTEETEEASEETDPAVTAEDIQARMDAIVNQYGITADMTDNDIAYAISMADGDTIKATMDEMDAIDEDAQLVAVEELLALEVELYERFRNVWDALFFPMPIVTVTGVSGVTVTNSNTTSFTESNGTITATVKSSFTTRKTATITITNSSDGAATVKFDYSASNLDTEDSGAFVLDGTSYAAVNTYSGTYSKLLDAESNITITFRAPRLSQTATLTLSNFSIVIAQTTSDVIFDFDDSKGTVTVDGTAIEAGSTQDLSLDTAAALVATPASGCSFLGWINDETGAVLSTSATYSFTAAEDATIKAVFVNTTSDTAWFSVNNGSNFFDDLNEAATFASSATNKTVVLMNNGTLAAGTYTIPSGVTLLVPYDAAHAAYTDGSGYSGETMTVPTAYCTLTIPNGTNIVVDGAMNVSGQYTFTNAGGQNGSPSGPLGFVNMESGSNITVNGNLYAFGYIIGSGTITAESGSVIHEIIQMPEYRGGSQSTGMENKVFAISQFYVQNIEVPLTLKAGSTEKTYGKIYASSFYLDTGVTLFGSGGMFELTSGYVTKCYDGTADRLNIQINGVAKMNSVSLTMNIGALGSGDINSADYVLPIHGGFTIHLKSGSSLTIPSGQEVLLQPGAQIIIDQGATCTVNSKLYIYDTDEWGAYCWYGHSGATSNNSFDTPVMPVAYSPTRTYIRASIFPDAATYPLPTTQAQYQANFANNITSGEGELNADKLASLMENLPDASILVNGTLSGNIYTTAGGANIYSTGSGTFIQSATENSSVYQFKQRSSTYDKASSNPAQLLNSNNTYTETADASGTYTYINGYWHQGTACSGGSATCQAKAKCETCGAEYGDLADHSWNDGVETTAPTCTQAGVKTYTCSVCGESYTEAITATSHSGGTATCTAKAICAACGQEYGELSSNHSGSAVWTQTADKHSKAYSCCGATVVAEESHEWSSGTCSECGYACQHANQTTTTVNATCTDAGSITVTCDDCGEIISTETVAATSHSYTYEVTKAATCAEAGVRTYTCGSCGASYTEEIEKLEHNMVAGDVTAPTCTAGGYTTYTCSYSCGTTEKRDAVVANGHSYSSVVTPPTCTTDGYTTYACTVCGDTYTADETDALGHSWTDADCDTPKTCSVCKVTEGEALGHTWTDATCTAAKTCSVCNATEGEALGHTWSDATCTAPKTCSVCGATEGEALGHSWNDATCTAAKTCSVCKVTEGEALGHSWSDADCDTPKTCSVCGATDGAALGHTWIDADCDTPKTCSVCSATEGEALGHTWNDADCDTPKTCSVCGETDGEALGHSYTSVVTAPTFEADGYTTYTCHCGDTYTVTDEGSKLTAVAQIGDTKYQTLPEAVGQAAEDNTVLLLADVALDSLLDATGVTIDLNSHTLTGTVFGTLKMNGGTLITAEGYKMAGPDAEYYKTENAVFTIFAPAEGQDLGNITVQSGTLTVVPEIWWTGEGQTLTIAENATFVIPQGVTMHVLSTVVVEGTVTVEGTVNLYSADATVTAPSGLNITTTAGDAVLYANGRYTVHDHTEAAAVVKNEIPATCTESGSYDNVVYCSVCEAELSRTTVAVPALGHDEITHAAQAPTCTEIGWDTYVTCSRCDYSTYAEKAALGHSYEAAVTDPTCTAGGYTTYTCSCGDTYTADEVAAKGHSWSQVSYVWSGLDDNKTGLAPVSEAEVTCTASRSCGCGESETAEAQIGSEITTPATCTAMGTTTYTASFEAEWATDGQTATRQDVAMIDHTYSQQVATDTYKATDATCTAPATYYYSCSCGAKGTKTFENGDKLGHTSAEAVEENRSEATCGEAGSYESVVNCSVCKAELSRETVTVPATGEHSYDNDCDTDCNVCGTTREITHDWNEGEVTTEATCTQDGVRTYTCSVCQATKTEAIEATSHSIVTVEAKAATCVDSGYAAYEYCTNCNYTTRGEDIPATGEHSWTEGTCTACGEVCEHSYTDGKCSVCGMSEPRELITLRTAMTLGNSLSMDFVIDTTKLENGGVDHYAVITKHYADGRADVVETVPYAKWTVYSGNQLQASFNGIAAKEMNDTVEVLIYDANGSVVSQKYSDSIKLYAGRLLAYAESANQSKLKTTVVDMLNYGAAAQLAFEYDTQNLANRDLSETQKTYATETFTASDHREKGAGYFGTAATLESQILLDFVFYDSVIGTDYTGMYAIATFTDHYNNNKTVRIEQFKHYANGYHYVSVTGLAIADCKQLVECTVYNAENEAIASAKDSLEGFVARSIAVGRGDEIYDAIMKFAASAYNYFH